MDFSFLRHRKPSPQLSSLTDRAPPNEDGPAAIPGVGDRLLPQEEGLEEVSAGARLAIGKLLQTSPRPLIHPEARMVVVFSPKSACSSVVIWFFHQVGHAKAACDYHRWPHQYRRIYYQSQYYRSALHGNLSDLAVVRVVRDPFDRAVSSFRHVLRSGQADAEIARLLKHTDIAAKGLSFAEFLDLLELSDLTTCDPHYGLQRHPLENVLPTRHLINVSTENLFTRLNQVEAEFRLPITKFDELEWIHNLDSRRNVLNAPKLDTADAYAQPFNREAARRGPWPPYDALLTTTARERIERLYAVDIAAYGTKPRAL